MIQKGLLEIVGRSNSDWAGDSATRQNVTGYHCNVQPESETDSDQSQFMRSRVLRSQHLRRRTVGTRRTLQGTALQRCSSSRDGFRLGKTHSTAQGTRRTQTHRKTSPHPFVESLSVHRLILRKLSLYHNSHINKFVCVLILRNLGMLGLLVDLLLVDWFRFSARSF